MVCLCDSLKFHRPLRFHRESRAKIVGDLERSLSRDSRRSRDNTLCTENTEELVVVIYILPPVSRVRQFM